MHIICNDQKYVVEWKMQINISMLYLENLKFFFLRNKRFIKDHNKPHCQELQKMKNTNLIKPIQIAQVTLQFWEIKLRKTKQKNKFERILWVRSISFPGSTPVCGVFYFPRRTCADNYPRSSWEKKHTPGSTQGS